MLQTRAKSVTVMRFSLFRSKPEGDDDDDSKDSHLTEAQTTQHEDPQSEQGKRDYDKGGLLAQKPKESKNEETKDKKRDKERDEGKKESDNRKNSKRTKNGVTDSESKVATQPKKSRFGLFGGGRNKPPVEPNPTVMRRGKLRVVNQVNDLT